MTFLSPTPALIAAAVSIPLLLLIYFLKLRRRPLRVSSTLLWEQAAKDLQVNVPLRWLRVSTVLILQLAALTSLLLALARPAIKGDAPTADRVVIIIDHSASMSARDGRPGSAPPAAPGSGNTIPTRLDEAKARAIELVRQLARGTTSSGERPAAMVVTSAATARVVQPLSTVTSDLVDAIIAIEPTDQPGDISAAAELLDAARSATHENVRRTEQIIAYTDLPPSIQPDTGGLPMRLIRLTAPLEPTASPTAGPPGSEAKPASDNLGIVALSVRRDLETPDTVRVFARIVGTNTQPVTTAVRCLFDGSPVSVRGGVAGASARSLTLSAGTAALPAEGTVSFEFTQRSGGVVLIALDRPDLLDADNAAAAIIGPVTTPAVLVVAPAEAPATGAVPVPNPDPFLVGFLESLHPRALRIVDLMNFESEAADAHTEQRRPWREFNLVIFDRTTPSAASVPPQPTISFGAGFPLAGLGLRVPDISFPASPGTVRFDTWRRAHPIMRYVALEPVIVSPAPPAIDTTPAPSSPAVSDPSAVGPPSNIVPLASGPDGPLIAALEEPGVGPHRIVVSFPLARSNWAPDTSFAVFMANAVDQLTGRGAAAVGRSYTTTEPITLHAAAGRHPSATITAAGPRTVTVDAPPPDADRPDAPRSVVLGVLDLAGVYRLTGTTETAVAVNLLDETESRLGAAVAPVVAGGSEGPALAPYAPKPAEPGGSEGRREVWHWFVLLAAVIASAEWLVFAWRFRA